MSRSRRTIDRARGAVARWGDRLRRRIDFWSLSQPKDPSPFAEWRQPGLSRHQLRDAVEGVVPTYTIVGDFVRMLFRFGNASDNSFIVETSSKNLRPLVSRSFLERRYSDRPIALFNVHSLDDLLRGIARELMVHGTTTLIAMWGHPRQWKAEKDLPYFRMVAPSSLKKIRLPGKVDGFEFASFRTWPPQDVELIQVDARDVIQFDWPLLNGRSRQIQSVSPVDNVVDLFKEKSRLEDNLMTVMESHAYPEKHSFRMERARWQKPSEYMVKIKVLDTAIKGELYGLIVDRPLTKYYDIYKGIQYLERLATVRDYLISQFNGMIGRFSELAGYKRPAKLIQSGYPSAEDCRQMLTRFTEREMSGSEAIQQLKGSS